MSADQLATDLIAVVVAVTGADPRILTIARGTALPSGSFESGHRSLQAGLRSWVERQTHQPLGYVEQLYTFADSDRGAESGRVMSVSYLGLTREAAVTGQDAGWQSWYRYFPWEDHRAGPPAMLDGMRAALLAWADTPGRRQRVAITFGQDGTGVQQIGGRQDAGGGQAGMGGQAPGRGQASGSGQGATLAQAGRAWNEELVLQRYELLFEAGLVAERVRRRGGAGAVVLAAGDAMSLDHRRILATGIARLRTKIKYRPVFFELMPESFTLLQLQQTVEALAGRRLHKQNFRRLIDAQDLVEETGGVSLDTGGRPAKLFRFRGGVQEERAIAGTKLPLLRS